MHGVVVDGLGVRRREKEDVENELLGRGDGLLTTADQGGDAATLRQNTATNRKRLLVVLLVVGLCLRMWRGEDARRQLCPELVVVLIQHVLHRIQDWSEEAIHG